MFAVKFICLFIDNVGGENVHRQVQSTHLPITASTKGNMITWLTDKDIDRAEWDTRTRSNYHGRRDKEAEGGPIHR